MSKMVMISQEIYDKFCERDEWLCALEVAGVDNWEGCSEARDILEQWKEENKNGEDN
jgi:hypothetical protein